MLKSSQDDFEVIGAFNPGVVEFGEMTYFLIRAAEKPREKRAGQIALPRAENGKLVIDWQEEDTITVLDERAVASKQKGFRLTNISHLRLAKSRDGINIDSIAELPTIFPTTAYEEFGIEDARITPIGNKFYITYVAVSRHGIATALASTKDFVRFERHGIIFPTENKDVVIFPEQIGNNYVAFHRPLSANPFGPPEMWLAYSPDLIHWGRHHCIVNACWDCKNISAEKIDTNHTSQRRRSTDWNFVKFGAGAPPIRTKEGWLEIYHGSYKTNGADTVGVYCAGATLFDLDKPYKMIARAKSPILVPEMEYERQGFLSSILFPTGVILKGNELLIYYGAADTYTAMTKLSLQAVLAAVKN